MKKRGKNMENKIKVFIYGNKLGILGKDAECGCNSKTKDGCGSGCIKCGSKEKRNVGDMFLELKNFIGATEVKSRVELKFIELDKNKIGQNEEIEDIINRGFESPIVVIDGIVRYYGGISNLLVYNDIKELLI